VSFPVVVLVSGEGSNLQALIDTLHGTVVEIVGVGSNKPDARGLERASGAGIATAVFPKSNYGGRPERDQALGDWIVSTGAELVVLAGFMEILSAGFIQRFPNRIVNVHPALLPAFAGIHAIEQALEYGVKVAGVTVHFVDEGVDSGPILLQEAFELPYHRDIAATRQHFHEVEHRLLPRAVRLIAAGRVSTDTDHPRLVRVESDD
jgi:phosphoribosylglycinamide formyltransferase 1